jgi:hypothetical protein
MCGVRHSPLTRARAWCVCVCSVFCVCVCVLCVCCVYVVTGVRLRRLPVGRQLRRAYGVPR